MGTACGRWGLTLMLALLVGAGVCPLAYAQEAAPEEVFNAFAEGISLYEAGEYEKAREAFDKVLSLRPGSQVALELRERTELAQLAEMAASEEVGGVASRLLDMMNEAVRQKRRVVENPDELLKNFQSVDLTTYGKARIRLIGHGPFAVPYLLEFLSLEGPQHQRVVARTQMAISQMHKDACLPLIEALATEDVLLKARIVGVLGSLADRRAVPALVAVCDDPDTAQALREAAALALAGIAGEAASFGAAGDEYRDMADAYLREDRDAVGFLYGEQAEVWRWDADKEVLAENVEYEVVPNYLYYQEMAAKVALDGLAVQPDSVSLQGILAAAVARQLSLCEAVAGEAKGAEDALGDVAEETKNDAAERAKQLGSRLPVLADLLGPVATGEALQKTLTLNDGASGLKLVRLLSGQREVERAGAMPYLLAALDSGDREVRFNAAVGIMAQCPEGTAGRASDVTYVMSLILQQAASRNALLIFDDLQHYNAVATGVQDGGFSAAWVKPTVASIGERLDVQPVVDVIFMTGNVPVEQFKAMRELLESDIRTKEARLYVVTDPDKPGVSAEERVDMAGALLMDELLPGKLAEILGGERERKAEEPGGEREALVRQAVEALRGVDPNITQYDLQMLVPALISALSVYGVEVKSEVIALLAAFAPGSALKPLGELAGSGGIPDDVRAQACQGIAAIVRRTGAPPDKDVIATLQELLAGDVQILKAAAAEALNAAGLPADQTLGMVHALWERAD